MQSVKRRGPGAAAALISMSLALAGCASSAPRAPQAVGPSVARHLASEAKKDAWALGIKHPPKASLIRFVAPEEWASTQVQCLKEAGFAAGLTTDGEGVSFPPLDGDALQEQLKRAIYTCDVEYPHDPKYDAPLTRAQLQHLYVYRSTRLVRCLQRLGHAPSERAPSESVFLRSKGAWSPYGSANIPNIDLRRTTRECPQDPADLYG